MPSARTLSVVILLLSLAVPVVAQQTAATAPQPLPLLQNSLAALVGSASLSDATLTGTVRRIAGADDETGTVSLKATSTGNSRMDFVLPAGTRGEVRTNSSTTPAGSWYGPDNVAHTIAYHNLIIDGSWFFSPFSFGRIVSSSNWTVTFVGQETKNGHLAVHLVAIQQFPELSGSVATLFSHLSQLDIYLDASTLLPVALDFSTHPDNDMNLDIPVEIRWSDYRNVGGVQIPFRVQKYLSYSLSFDFQIQSAVFNTGLSASNFTLKPSRGDD